MRLSKREIKDTNQLYSIVETCNVVRIAACDKEGLFIVPMNYGYDWEEGSAGNKMTINADELEATAQANAEINANANASQNAGSPKLTLWLHSAVDGRKVQAFASSQQVAIEMDMQDGLITGEFSCAYSYAYRSIMGTGVITKIEDTDTKVYGLTKIVEHVSPNAEASFSEEAVKRCNIYRIDVEHFTGKQRM